MKLKKHKALEEKYDHYVCEFCMEIGAKEAIKEFLADLKTINFTLEKTKAINLYPYVEKWEGRSK